MKTAGKIRLVVTRTILPVRTIEVIRPIYSPTGVKLGSISKVGVVYAASTDEYFRDAVREAEDFSARFGLDLEVVHAPGFGIFGRLISIFRSVSRPS